MIRWLLDLGHSRYKAAVAHDRELLADSFHTLSAFSRKVPSKPVGGNAELAWPTEFLLRYGRPDEIIVAAVVPAAEREAALTALLAAAPELKTARRLILVSPPRFGDLVNAYCEPEQLGIDRFAALVAAREMVKTSLIVADAGSALTLDAADAAGRHLGGWIIPGIEQSREALGRIDPLLASAAQNEPGEFGRDTDKAIAGGLLNAQTGAVERMLRLLKRRGQSPIHLFLTGGGGAALLPLLFCEAVYDPLLVLRGMLAMAAGGR